METSTIKENPPSIMSIDDDDTQDTEQEEEKYNEYDDDSDDEIFYLEDDEDEDDGGVIANQHHIHKMVDVANQYLKGLFFKVMVENRHLFFLFRPSPFFALLV